MKSKIRKAMVLSMAVGMCITGCNNGDTPEVSQLEVPNVVLQGNTIKWNAVENASAYEVKIGDQVFTTNATSYELDIDTAGNYQVSVRAISSDEKYEESDFSSKLNYKVVAQVNRLKAPVASINGNVVTWDSVENATSYDVYVGLSKTNVTTTTYTLPEDITSSSSIYVVALTTNEAYSQSLASNIVRFNKSTDASNFNQVSLFNRSSTEIESTFDEFIDTVNERQLYDTGLWSRFVEQFRYNTDGDGYGWRGEFWGKMMEGAVITYNATHDEKLYKILVNTTEDLLTTQQANGSISSYGDVSKGNSDEFTGWDMWCKNWTLTGLTYFYSICKDSDLKARVLNSLERQLDWIIKNVGDGPGKKNINDTATQWGGLPASDMLEVVCKIYKLTDNKDYLDFATHIIENGGSKYGNQFEQAIANETLPYTWGAPKAGELCMLFDGALEYYYITGIEKYKTAAINFWNAVNESEITLVGGGCTKDEQFEHSAIQQSDPTKTGAQQEFCVTIHWLNFSKDIYQLTKDPKVIDSMERTIYNAVLCCYDNEHNYDHVFTSYNNLVYSVRTTSAAGGMGLSKPYTWSYGCCISQGSIATGLIPQLQYATNENGIYANLYLPGTTTGKLASGSEITIKNETTYPVGNKIKLTLGLTEAELFDFSLRIPYWSENSVVKVNGEVQTGSQAGEYYTINRTWSNGDVIELELEMNLVAHYGSEECSYEDGKNMVAVTRGPLTFARDARLDGGNIIETVELALDENGNVKYQPSNTATFENIMEIEIELTNGKKIHLVNYGHAGKTYSSESMFTVYMPTTDYWKVPFTGEKGVVMVNSYFNAVTTINSSDGLLHTGNSIEDYTDLSNFAVRFEENEEGYYYIKHIASNKYLTIVSTNGGHYLQYQDFEGGYNQQFTVENASLLSYKIGSRSVNYIVSANNERDAIWMYSDCSSNKQYWTFMPIE